MIRIGSLFSGIGGFELGIESACPGARTIWQVEQNPFSQKILKKHWPDAALHSDVRHVGKHNLEPVDMLLGGFPCQDISVAGLGRGLYGEKSSLWFEMHRLISELRPRIAIMENVPAVTFRGLSRILGSLSEIGYDAEWQIISARQFGALHLRKRWFCVAYQSELSDRRRPSSDSDNKFRTEDKIQAGRQLPSLHDSQSRRRACGSFNSDSIRTQIWKTKTFGHYWHREAMPEPVLCRVANGIPDRVARLKALGNAIVPQCSEYIGYQLLKSGLIDDLI